MVSLLAVKESERSARLIIQKIMLYHEVWIINLLSFLLLASLEFEQVRFISDSEGL